MRVAIALDEKRIEAASALSHGKRNQTIARKIASC